MSSQQEVVALTPVALFQSENGQTIEKGNCAAAIVGFPSNPPKFSLVCYNDKRETFCMATITGSNEHSLQFSFSTNDYATFQDDKARKWSIMFLKSAEVPKFVAAIGACLFAASGSPSHQAIVGDLALTATGTNKLDLSQRCKVHYHAFTLNRDGALPKVEKLLETNGDRAYNFHPVQSAGAMLPEAKGFESSVLGMTEEARRVIVVPSAMPRSGTTPYGENVSVVFVVELIRIIPDGDAGAIGNAANGSVPTVFGEMGPPAIVAPPSSSTALALVPAESDTPKSEQPNLDEKSSASKGTAGGVGAGVPAEHMGMIQNAAAKINNATTSARDLHDKIVGFQDDWKQTINRPKPSALTNEALEQNVKSLVMDHDRLKDEIARRDELIRSLDERNRDLQKRVDRAAMVAQQLMDEKQSQASTASDSKLEKDRQIMKIQEQITRSSSERDDVHRHLQTIKKLLEVSDNELKDTKGKAEVLKVQASSIAGKLDAVEDQLAEERSRRKALEAKAAALQDEIRNHETDLHMKSAEHEEILRKADAERMHCSQLMEDERQRRAFEAQQLRSEIINELQLREDKFQADRARVAEDNFARGHDEGKEIGRRNARIDVEARLQELQLEAQRAKTALDAYKTELREKNDESMAENRRLEAIVTTLKTAAEDATRTKAASEYKLHTMQSKVKNAEDALFLAFTNVAHRLSRPAPTEDLVRLLTQIREAESLDFGFLSEQHQAEAQTCFEARYEWISSELEVMYEEKLNEAFTAEFLQPLNRGMDATKEAVRQLWEERDRAMFGSVFDEEMAAREANEAEEIDEFKGIEDLLAAMITAQGEVISEEEQAREPIDAEGNAFFGELEAFALAQQKEREDLCDEEDAVTKQIMEDEEATEFKQIIADFETVVYEKIIAEQQDVIEEEVAPRTSIEEEELAEFTTLTETDFVESKQAAEAAQQQREEEEEAERKRLEEEAEAARKAEEEAEAARKAEEEAEAARKAEEEAEAARKAEEEAEAARKAEEEAEAARKAEEEAEAARKAEEEAEAARKAEEEAEAARKAEEEAEAARKAEEEAAEEEAKRKTERKALSEDVDEQIVEAAIAEETKASEATTEEAAAPATSESNRPPATEEAPSSANPPKTMMFGSDSDDDPLGAARARSAEKKTTTTAAPLGGDDSDSDAGIPARRPAPKPKAKKSMFGGSDSDSDSDGKMPSPLAKRSAAPPKRAAGKKAAIANMFGSDSDSDAAPPAPKPAAKAKRAPPKASKMFESSSESD